MQVSLATSIRLEKVQWPGPGETQSHGPILKTKEFGNGWALMPTGGVCVLGVGLLCSR